ncbi:MAG: DUF262 domain-containing protein, partial [Polyangiaceae bacterium]|nr:DUF262 domain-containing protein [Polyangiaceae bacterium]
YRNGVIVIPEFQRDYVWKPGKAPKLVDSLYHGYPISSLLVWDSADDEVKTRRRDARPSRGETTSWLIDGQQRVITLARAMVGDENIDVVFNAQTEEFQQASAATRKDPSWFRVADLWEDESYRRIRKGLADGSAGERIEARFERVRAILAYEVPIVRMVEHPFKGAVQAFTRINTLGVRLKKQDIDSAEVAARHSGFIRNEVAPFLKEIHEQGFSRIYVTHLFRACAFVAHPDGRKRTPLHELQTTEVLAAWKRTKKAVEDAIALVGSELGLVNMSILWSGSLMVPVIALCATQKADERDAKAIAGWMALAALTHRFSGASETALDQDMRACRMNDPIGALLSNLRQSRSSLNATSHHFVGALADRSGLFAVYVGCRQRGALDLFTGAKIFRQAGVERHPILPRSLFDVGKRASADTLANTAFVAGDGGVSNNSEAPDAFLAKIKRQVLESQCIPRDSQLWSIKRAEEFWSARRELLAEAFNEFIRGALPNRKI